MPNDFYIFDFSLEDVPRDWEPTERLDFDVWITVNVGDGNAGAYYYVHICTPMSIPRLTDKRSIFMIDEWCGLDDLIARMNQYIEESLTSYVGDPYHKLAKEWSWEYDNYR